MDETLRDVETAGVVGVVGAAAGVKPGTILTVAGNGERAPEKDNGTADGEGGKATAARLQRLAQVTTDQAGNVFLCVGNRVRKISPDGTITTVAGTGHPGLGLPGGGEAIKYDLGLPLGVAVDRAGNLFITERNSSCVSKVVPAGYIVPVAGTSYPRGEEKGKAHGDGGKAVKARLQFPHDAAVDSDGNLFIIDSLRIRKVSTDGTITTVAGDGTQISGKDGDKAAESGIPLLGGLAVDRDGNVHFSEAGTDRVRKVTRGVLTTVAGSGQEGFAGDGGKATEAKLNQPHALAFDQHGNLYIADYANRRVRKVTPDGTITTIAGNGTKGARGDGSEATAAELNAISGLTVDPAGNLLIADAGEHRVRMVVGAAQPPRTTRTVKTISGYGHLDNQHAEARQPFGQELQVEARDKDGDLVPHAHIRFQADAASGSKFTTASGPSTSAETETNTDGVATAPKLIAGSTPGRVTITVTAPTSKGHAPATYTAHVDPAT